MRKQRVDFYDVCGTLPIMKHLVLIIALISFFVGGLAEMTHAAAPELVCSHYTNDSASVDQDCMNEQDQDQNDFQGCQDCCCHHMHVLAKIFPDANAHIALKAGLSLMPNEAPRSRSLSPLYRPPIA